MNRKTNVDLFKDTYKGTMVPAKCTASQLCGIFEYCCYWGKRVRGDQRHPLGPPPVGDIGKCPHHDLEVGGGIPTPTGARGRPPFPLACTRRRRPT